MSYERHGVFVICVDHFFPSLILSLSFMRFWYLKELKYTHVLMTSSVCRWTNGWAFVMPCVESFDENGLQGYSFHLARIFHLSE
jgi:hypothetical protein